MEKARTLLRVALPTSILTVEHGLALKSIRIHQVARWTSIFGVYEVIFYKEPAADIKEFQEHRTIIEDHWRYFFTPPYLRKQLIPLTPTLRYVGMLPPIRLKSFDVGKRPKTGEVRLGYVYRDLDGKFKALVGDTSPYLVIGNCRHVDKVIPLLIRSAEKRVAECLEEHVYAGPTLSFINSFKDLLDKYRKTSKYVIATDKMGEIPSDEQVKELRGSDAIILFGSPKYDLFEIASQEGLDLKKYVDYVWNTVPFQKVVTVRTEEALIITLGVLNFSLRGI